MNLEYFIRDELNKNTSLEDLADKVVHKLSLSKAGRRAKSVGIEFLLKTGFYTEAQEVLLRLVKEKEHIPWPHLIEFFQILKSPVNEQVMTAAYKGAKEYKKLKNLVRHRGWDKKEPKVLKIREQVVDAAREKVIERQEALKRKIQFLESNRMIEQEHKAFKEYMKKYPEDQSVVISYKAFKERWARHYLTSSAEAATQDISQAVTSDKSEDLKMAKASFDEAIQLVKKFPQLTYDLAMNFYFADLPSYALELIQQNETPETFWLRLELMIKSEKFLQALQVIEEQEKRDNLTSEDQFAFFYARALCFRGLGKNREALEVLSHILELQPNYRAAESLYHELKVDLGASR